MSAVTSPALRPSGLASMLISRFRSRRLIWFGPVTAFTSATCDRRTTRGLPSAVAAHHQRQVAQVGRVIALARGQRRRTS
jgi:hypothetical protein